MRAIRKQLANFIAIIGLGVIAGGVALYILDHQRLRFPWEETPYKLKFEFTTAQAVTPGQGQTVRVSGIRIGDISKVELKDGSALVSADIDQEFKGVVKTDWHALLRPKTGLKDMFIELMPPQGGSKGQTPDDGFTLPVANTLPDVNLDEVLASLDTDTRDYLKLLVNGAGRGLRGRGNDLREVLIRFEPTHRDLARVNKLVAKRHRNLRRLIHSLNELNGKLASKDEQLGQLVSASSQVFRAFASEQNGVRDSVAELPSALRTTTATLRKVETFADELAPAADALRPAARKLDSANRALLDLGKEIAPVIRSQIRPFTRDARPVVRSLSPTATNLAKATPDLTGSFEVLNHLFNMVGYNDKGREAPGAANRTEGYLFWLAWLQHNGAALFSADDANGPFRPITISSFCGTIKQVVDSQPALGALFAPSLFDPAICNF
jgi:phospholipid/cholesterol/gamma-HCH transport system substrate-binding protein